MNAVLDSEVEVMIRNRVGQARPDHVPGARICRSGQHLIVYRLSGATVTIVDIVHERMDIARRAFR